MAERIATSAGRRRPAAWVWFLAGAPVVVSSYYLAGYFGDGSYLIQAVLYSSCSLAAAVAIWYGRRRNRPAHGAPWLLLMCGALCTLTADTTYTALETVLGEAPYPSVADALYLGSYPLLAAALLVLVRHRTPGWDTASTIDAAIIAISAGLLYWVFLIAPWGDQQGEDRLTQATTAMYPTMDLLLLIVAARLLLGVGARTTSFRLLCGYLLLALGTDTVYGVQALQDTYVSGGYLDGFWMVAAFLLGASALHPSMARLTDRSAVAAPDASVGRLAVLALASVVAPATLLVQHLRGADLHVLPVAGACVALFLLVLLRMALLVRTQRLAAITDGLTGLRTRRFFEEALRGEAERSRRSGSPLGVLLLDIDHFKSVNDTYGHGGGDRVLCEVAHRLRNLVRPGDLVARYGGEEFAILLPHTSPPEVTRIGQRVLRGVSASPIAVNASTLARVTTSIGSACLPQSCSTTDELVLTADRALYAAKAAGRNQLVTSGPADTAPAADDLLQAL